MTEVNSDIGRSRGAEAVKALDKKEMFPLNDPSYQLLLIDAHVHIYDCFNLDAFFSSAYENFKKYTPALPNTRKSYFLLLAESPDCQWFKMLWDRDSYGLTLLKNWIPQKTTEEITLLIQHKTDPDKKIYIVAGRQIVTAEKLELLALFTRSTFQNNQTLSESISDINKNEGIPVIPWGAGKWVGQRRSLLTKFLKSRPQTNNSYFLGDNGGRPLFWLEPLFSKNTNHHLRPILAGSDPLPLKQCGTTAGSYGVLLREPNHTPYLAQQVKNSLLNAPNKISTFGHRQNLFSFIRVQLALRAQKKPQLQR